MEQAPKSSTLLTIFRNRDNASGQGSPGRKRAVMRVDDYLADAVLSTEDLKVAFPKATPYKASFVVVTDKLLCIGSKDSFKHVLNLKWMPLSDLILDDGALELAFTYDEPEKKVQGKFRADNLDDLVAFEKAIRKAVDASHVLQLPVRPAHKTMSIYVQRDGSDETLLIKLIDGFTKLDEFFWLKTAALNLLKQGGLQVDSQGILDRCLRPCNLLARRADIPEYADTRFCDPIAFLESELLVWVDALEVQKLSPLAEAIRKLVQYYSRTRQTFRQLGYSAAVAQPATLTVASHLASPRIIDTAVMKELWSGPKEGQGLALVTKKHGVYWKQNPSHPGVEFATDSISALVATRATSASCLVKFSYQDDNNKPKSHLVLASKAVFGKTLRETLQTSPNDINVLDMEAFSEIFIISLLTCPQDWKSDNLIVSKMEGKTSLVGIDNDHSFADPIIRAGAEGKHTINVKNILFCLPQCDEAIHPSTRQKLLNIDPIQLLLKWTLALNKQNDLYQSLLDEKFLSILDLKQLNLPIRLRHGTLLEAYRVLREIQAALKDSERITLNAIFLRVYPVLFHYYSFFNRQRQVETNLENHFNTTIWATPFIENFSELMETPITLNGENVLIKDAIKNCTHTAWDLFKGDRMPIEEFETLLKEVDFSNSTLQSQMETILLMKKLRFMNLTIIGSSDLTGGDLAAFTNESPGLIQIQLIRCPKITKDALNHAIFRTRNIALYLSSCPMSAEEALEMTGKGFNVTLLEAGSAEPRGSMNLEAPQLFHALESIRSGRFSEACDHLKEAAAYIPPAIINKYRDRLLSNLSLPDLMRSKHAELISFLVKNLNWNINAPTMTGQRPWHFVIQVGDVSWAKTVVSICPGLSINCQNAELETCLHLAVQEGDNAMLQYLVEELHCDQTICDKKMRTPLSRLLTLSSLTADQKTTISKILIDSYKDLNEWRDVLMNSYLHIALRNRLLTISARLIASGINLNTENMHGETPLHIACSSRCRDIAENGLYINLASVLVERGANPLAKTKLGRTPMHYAIRGGSRTIVASLASASPTLLSMPDSQGLTPMHLAAEFVSAAANNAIREFIEPKYNLDWNAKSGLGLTPLIVAAQKSNWLAIEMFCQVPGLEVDATDGANNTALFYAVSRSCLPAVSILLKKKGSNPNKGSGMVSPMWRAVQVLYKDLMNENQGDAQNSSMTPPPNAGPPSSGRINQPSSVQPSSLPSLAIGQQPQQPQPSKVADGPSTPRAFPSVGSNASDYTGGPLLNASQLCGLRHDIAQELFHYGGDMESQNLAGSFLIHEVAQRSLKDALGVTGPAEFEFIYANAPHAILALNKNGESFIHILARGLGPSAPSPLINTIRRLWKRYLNVNQTLAPAFFEKETSDGSSLVHLLVQSSNDILLDELAQKSAGGGPSWLARLRFPFDGSKTLKKHPIMSALEIGHLGVCSILFEHMTLSFSKSEWKLVQEAAKKVGCLDMAKNAQTRNQK